MQLYGREWSRRELEERVGRLEQVGGLRRCRGTEGAEAGVAQIEVRTGAGLAYTVVPSRAMDISLAEFGGAPLSWQSPNGVPHPAFYEPEGQRWLRTAVGGLLMTCGLTQVGAPSQDNGQDLGQHGRVHHIPARQVVAEGRWQEDEYEMRLAGVVEETAIFGEYLRLTREIRSWLGRNRIVISDTVENMGFAPTPHMLLYHFNFGFPLLSEETEIHIPSQRVVARDEGIPVPGYDRWQAPEAGYQEHVYYHEAFQSAQPALSGTEERVNALVVNPRFPLPGGERPLIMRLTWSPTQLPRMVQWKMPGAGTHVLGLEPANCHVDGRAGEREKGTLVVLEPGEARQYDMELEVTLG